MGLRKIEIDTIGNIIEAIIKSLPLFSNYKLVKKDIQELSSPTEVINYDFVFISAKYNRWMFVRLQDFFKHQNLVIWINELINKKNTNIDLGNYFISELNNKKIKQQLFFKIHSENDLKNKLECAFRNINEQMDDKLKKVLMGELWINTPLDWGDYK
tara:strand:- start:133 stop:603 length:471 start_codon:yes stop_codon:yes gene_type:complete